MVNISMNNSEESKEEKTHFNSPNIVEATEDEAGEAGGGEEYVSPDVDGVPIAESDIEYRSNDIAKKDGADLFVNVEDAEKILKHEEKIEKKKEKERKKDLAKSLREKSIEEKQNERQKKKEIKKEERQAKKRKRTKFTRKGVFVFALVVVAALGYLAYKGVSLIIANNRSQAEIENARWSEEDFQREATSMMKIYAKLIGKKMNGEELEKEVKSVEASAMVYYYDDDGAIYMDGTTENINFDIVKSGNMLTVKNYHYRDCIGGYDQLLYKAENIYYYSDGVTVFEFDDLYDAFRTHVRNRANEYNINIGD